MSHIIRGSTGVQNKVFSERNRSKQVELSEISTTILQ